MAPFRTATIGILALASLAVAAPERAAWAQSAGTIRVVISVPPGGIIDFLVRLLADRIGRSNGPTIIIESRPGAGGVIAAEAVARAAPDGATLLVNNNGMVINAILRKVNFDPVASFEPICYLVSSPQLIVVNAASPYRTLADFIGAARAKPAELSLASVGPNTTQHIAIERLKRLTGIDLTYVPYPGGAPAINALLGAHVTAALQNYFEVGEQLTAGTLRVLATATARRIAALPEVPTVAESGYPDFAADVWFGLVAPAKTPAETASQLIGSFSAALAAPEVKAKLAVHAVEPEQKCGADFAAFIRRQVDQYARLLRELDFKRE
jgi:tripartite-type tricarboxylate transporter receptor subunit TctC